MSSNNGHVIEAARQALAEGWAGVLGLRERWGHVGPYVFTSEDELNDMVLEPRYPMASLLRELLEATPGRRLAVVARGCDARALKAMLFYYTGVPAEERAMTLFSLKVIPMACSEEQAAICNCEKPNYDRIKCTGCWECVEACGDKAITVTSACPIVVPNEFDGGLSSRRAVYCPYPQAVPRWHLRDPEHCLALNEKMDCKGCTNICKAEAVIAEDEAQEEDIEVGAIVVTPGFETFLARQDYDFGYSRFPDVVTSMDFERILSASGPYAGHVKRPSDGKEPKRIAFLQCVGSRDISCRNRYCSSVCCMYAIKEAVIAKEHMQDVEVTVFFMDIRAFGKEFDKYYERAKTEHGVRFVRARVSDVSPNDRNGRLTVQYSPDEGAVAEDTFDMVVLSSGLEPPAQVKRLEKTLGVRLEPNGFVWTDPSKPLDTSRAGVYVAGAASGPKDIPETVTQASGAAARASQLLADRRHTLTVKRQFPPERDVSDEKPRIGVFICHCGINIGGVVDVPAVVEHIRSLPNVVHTEDNLYTCSQDTQDHMREVIEEHRLNRVVVASCSPRTHEALFQQTMRESGLNPHLFEMANIRDQCSWIHMHEPDEATVKAKCLVHMAIAKAAMVEALAVASLDVTPTALVVGGGLAGLTAALSLAEQGFEVTLVERERKLGGNLNRLRSTFTEPDVRAFRDALVRRVRRHPEIDVRTGTELEAVDGFVGNFESTLKGRRETTTVKHGVMILATGGNENTPDEYRYVDDSRVVTQLELEQMLADGSGDAPRSVVMIQCVGSREEGHMYCSRVCCNTAVKNAIRLKDRSPETDVWILYRDIRTYGLNEDYYQEARDKGVVFVRYEPEAKPVVKNGSGPTVTVRDALVGRDLVLRPDLLVLSSRIDANHDNERIGQLMKVPLNEDGFFLEAHAKLRPVEFATEGVFVAGLAHGPKSVPETIAQAEAAAAKACTIISKEKYDAEPTIAALNDPLCDGCGICVPVCEYNALEVTDRPDGAPGEKVVKLNEAMCKGCGGCVAACPSGAMEQKGFKDSQMLAMIEAALAD